MCGIAGALSTLDNDFEFLVKEIVESQIRRGPDVQKLESYSGEKLPRIVQRSFNLENPEQRQQFLEGNVKRIKVPGMDKTLPYDSLKRLGIGHAVLDTSQAVAIGAYVFALNQLDAQKQS